MSIGLVNRIRYIHRSNGNSPTSSNPAFQAVASFVSPGFAAHYPLLSRKGPVSSVSTLADGVSHVVGLSPNGTLTLGGAIINETGSSLAQGQASHGSLVVPLMGSDLGAFDNAIFDNTLRDDIIGFELRFATFDKMIGSDDASNAALRADGNMTMFLPSSSHLAACLERFPVLMEWLSFPLSRSGTITR